MVRYPLNSNCKLLVLTDQVGWMTEKIVLSLDWCSLTSPLGISPAQHSIQQTKSLLGNILYPGQNYGFSTILECLHDIIPWTPALGHAHGSTDPFLHLIRACIYLASNNLLNQEELDNFLRWVLQNGYAPLLDQLLDRLGQRGGNLNLDVFLFRLLLSACSLEEPQVVMALLNRGADPNKGSDGRETVSENVHSYWSRKESDLYPLQMAILHEDSKTVQILLHHKANPNSRTIHLPFRPLELAITHHLGTLDMVRLLVVAGADLHFPCRLEPTLEILNNDWEAWKPFREIESGNVLAKASYVQNLGIAQHLIRELADFDKKSKSLGQALQIAVRNNDTSMVDLFLENGADVDMADSLGPLIRRFVITRIQEDMHRKFHESQRREGQRREVERHKHQPSLPQDLPQELTPPVYAAATTGNSGLLRRLVQHGASLHLQLDWDMILDGLSPIMDFKNTICKLSGDGKRNWTQYFTGR